MGGKRSVSWVIDVGTSIYVVQADGERQAPDAAMGD